MILIRLILGAVILCGGTAVTFYFFLFRDNFIGGAIVAWLMFTVLNFVCPAWLLRELRRD